MAEGVALAVDVGGTRIRAALVDSQGRVMHRQSLATPAQEGADAVVAAIAKAARAVMAAGGADKGLQLGLCAPGPLDARKGIALATPTIRGFTNFPLARQGVGGCWGFPSPSRMTGPVLRWANGPAGRGRVFRILSMSRSRRVSAAASSPKAACFGAGSGLPGTSGTFRSALKVAAPASAASRAAGRRKRQVQP